MAFLSLRIRAAFLTWLTIHLLTCAMAAGLTLALETSETPEQTARRLLRKTHVNLGAPGRCQPCARECRCSGASHR